MPEPAHNRSKVTLENLLRLKRHERPGAEFWVRFDRELRERSMRELMDTAPSRWGWLEVLLGRRMAWMTTGATAALVLSFVWHGTLNHSITANAPSPLAQAPRLTASVHVPSAVSASTPGPAIAASDLLSTAEPKFVVAALSEPRSTSSFEKVPATLALAAGSSSNIRYTADALVDVALAGRINQSAY